LAFHGYVQGGVEQTAGGVLGVRLVMSVYPAVPALIGAAIMLFYPLTNKMLVDIEKDLNDRRRKAGELEPDKT
jgi:glycoside/pentoside/hexuronide:cation symporter, GPH family